MKLFRRRADRRLDEILDLLRKIHAHLDAQAAPMRVERGQFVITAEDADTAAGHTAGTLSGPGGVRRAAAKYAARAERLGAPLADTRPIERVQLDRLLAGIDTLEDETLGREQPEGWAGL